MSAIAEVISRNYYLYDAGEFGESCRALIESAGFTEVGEVYAAAIAIGPRLTRKLRKSEWSAPTLGTLIFHPSILPYRRGPDAIRRAMAAGERVSGVTWFWCNGRLDAGPICEQDPVLLKPGESPGEAYKLRFIPAGLRALHRALSGIVEGFPRAVAQDESLATYDSWLRET